MLRHPETKTFPLTESNLALEISHLEPVEATEDAKEKIEAMKAERTCAGFIKAVKDEKDLWTIFLEHFHSDEAFSRLLDRKRYASALSGVMKMIVDFYSLQEHGKRSSKLKQEIEVLEKHKAYLMNVNALREGIRSRSPHKTEVEDTGDIQSQTHGGWIKASEKYKRRDDDIFDPQEIGGQGMTKNFTGSSKFEKDYKTKKDTELEKIKSMALGAKRVLPTYDIERLQKLAEKAESQNLQRNEHLRISKDYRPAIKKYEISRSRGSSRSANDLHNKHTKTYDEDNHGETDNDKPQSLYSSGDRFNGRRPNNMRLNEQSDPYIYDSQQRSPLSPSKKFEEKRHEYKRKKTSGGSDSESPSPQKEENAESERQTREVPFERKMQNYDYSHLRKSKDIQQGNPQQYERNSNDGVDIAKTQSGRVAGQGLLTPNNKLPSNNRGAENSQLKTEEGRTVINGRALPVTGNGKYLSEGRETPTSPEFGKVRPTQSEKAGVGVGSSGGNSVPSPKDPSRSEKDIPNEWRTKQKESKKDESPLDQQGQGMTFSKDPTNLKAPSPASGQGKTGQGQLTLQKTPSITNSKGAAASPLSNNGGNLAQQVPSLRRPSEKSVPEGVGTNSQASKAAGGALENKSLVPMVPESSKNDYFAQAQRDNSKKESQKRIADWVKPTSKLEDRRTERHQSTEAKGDNKSVRSSSDSRHLRDPREKSKPGLDNRNPGYKSAFLKDPKNFLVDMGVPNFDGVKGSGYGKIDKDKKRSVSSRSQ